MDKLQLTSSQNALYEWQDLASGLGYIDFYLGVTYSEGTNYYYLVTQPLRSHFIEFLQHVGDSGGPSTSGSSSVNFDTSVFNTPREIEGTVFVSFSTYFHLGYAGNSAYLTVGLYKYDINGTETLLGSARTATEESSGSEVANQTLSFDVSKTHLEIGTKLRLKVTMSAAGEDGHYDECYFLYGVDPLNRDGTQLTPSSDGTTTQFKVSIPFRVGDI